MDAKVRIFVLMFVVYAVLMIFMSEIVSGLSDLVDCLYQKGRWGWFPKMYAETGDVLRARVFLRKERDTVFEVVQGHKKWHKVLVKRRYARGSEPETIEMAAHDHNIFFSRWHLVKKDGRIYPIMFTWGYPLREITEPRLRDAQHDPPVPT